MPLDIQKSFTIEGHEAPVYALESFGNNKIFSGGGDRIICSSDLKLNSNLNGIVNTGSTIYSLRFINEKNLLLAGVSSGGMHIIDLKERKEKHFLLNHEKGIFDIQYSSAHELIFSAGGDGKISIWSGENFSFINAIQLCNEKVRSIVIDKEESYAYIATGDGFISVLKLPGLKIVRRFKAHETSVNVVTLHPYLNLLISGGKDAHLNFWNLDHFDRVHSIPAHNYAIYSIAYSPTLRYFATGSRDKTIKIWDGESFEIQTRIDSEKFGGHKYSVNKILWLENYLVSTGDDKKIICWRF